MRLIRLRIRNIASLKGEHEIDFLEIQRCSSLFAITGETGSGKSTILNCIGLTLYGQIYKKNMVQLDVVTLGEREGSIELIFQVKGKNYLADWRARVLKQNGEPYSSPQPPTRNLYTLEGEEFSSPKIIAQVTSSELLNLDFDQFCKCIILNQGEFARFLTSSFTERKHILEKLYPGELLDNISKELDQEKKGLEKKLEALQIELQTLQADFISGVDLKIQKASLEQNLSILDKENNRIEKIDYHFTSLFSYFKRFKENEERKKQVKEELTVETKKFNHLLKESESIQASFEEAKTQQEKELPMLQKLVEKEGTLKLLEENLSKTQKSISTAQEGLSDKERKLLEKEREEKERKEKLTKLAQEISHPLEELRKGKLLSGELFDLFSEKEILSEEIKGKSLKLTELEERGIELKKNIEELEYAISLLPPDVEQIETSLLKKKEELQKKSEHRQRIVIQSEETSQQIKALEEEIRRSEEKITSLGILKAQKEKEIYPLETNLALSEVLSAAQICVEHAMTSDQKECPVCERELPLDQWGEIKTRLDKTDLNDLKKIVEEGKAFILKTEQEMSLLSGKVTQENEQLKIKKAFLENLKESLTEEVPFSTELDQEIQDIRKKALELRQYKKEFDAKNDERNKLRVQFKLQKDELNNRQLLLLEKQQKLENISNDLGSLIPELSRDLIRDLKREFRLFNAYEEEEAELLKITREKDFLVEKKTDQIKELEILRKSSEEELSKISLIRSELKTHLKEEKASELIQKINHRVRVTGENWSKHLQEENKQEQTLKGLQARLNTLDELTKDFDLQFTNEIHALKSLVEITSEREDTIHLLDKLKNLFLSFDSPEALYLSLNDLIKKTKASFKEASNECRMLLAAVSEKLSAWEKRQDRIQLTELKLKEVNDKLQKKIRLFEVLGRDELRNFVLSLVEENLIFQTNQELQKLCQGRYEIIHQTKSMRMSPDFFILDKFREGGKRKVSTLSGGETFMVSLAMALGLAEMTRGKAEIDSLFIDEGFGTLDQESLEDVLDMLQQIQTRGLMVGIISHIKTLTSAIPVNLVLNKKQDGTSTTSIRMN